MGGANSKRLTRNKKNKSARQRWLKALREKFREQDITSLQVDSVCPKASFVPGFDLQEMRRLMVEEALTKGSLRTTSTGFHVVDTSHKSSSKRPGRVVRGGEKKPTGKTQIPREVIPALVLLVLERLYDSDVRQPCVGDIWGFDPKLQMYTRSAVGVLLVSMVSDGHLEVQGPKGRYWYRVTKKGIAHLKARKPKPKEGEVNSVSTVKKSATPTPTAPSSVVKTAPKKDRSGLLDGFSRDNKNRLEMLTILCGVAGDGWYSRSEFSARLREHFGWGKEVHPVAIGRIIFALSGTNGLLETRGEKAQQELRLSPTGRSVLRMEVPEDVTVPPQPVEIPQAEVAETEVPVPMTGVGRTVDIAQMLSQVATQMGLIPDEVFGVDRPPILLSTASDSGEVARLTAALEAERVARQVAEADAAQVRADARLLAEAFPGLMETLDSLRAQLASLGMGTSSSEN